MPVEKGNSNIMDWQKTIFSGDQIADGEYERLHNKISEIIFTDARYQNVAVWTTYPNEELTITAYFSPDAVRYFSDLIAPYSPTACAAPTGEKLSCLAVDPDRLRIY